MSVTEMFLGTEEIQQVRDTDPVNTFSIKAAQ